MFLRNAIFCLPHQFSKKMTLAGLNSLWQKNYQISVKNWIFDDPFLDIGQLGARDDQTIRISIFLMKWGCKGHWGHGGCWGCRGHWGCRGFKAWKITNEDFGVIQVLVISFILMTSIFETLYSLKWYPIGAVFTKYNNFIRIQHVHFGPKI